MVATRRYSSAICYLEFDVHHKLSCMFQFRGEFGSIYDSASRRVLIPLPGFAFAFFFKKLSMLNTDRRVIKSVLSLMKSDAVMDIFLNFHPEGLYYIFLSRFTSCSSKRQMKHLNAMP